jgi:GxxExxY protein
MNTDGLTEQVLGAVFEVSNTLGAGFLEKVYRRALLQELRIRGIRATGEAPRARAWANTLRTCLSRMCSLSN